AKSAVCDVDDLTASTERKGSGDDAGSDDSSTGPRRRSLSTAIRLEPNRDFVPARQDVAELSELADLEKVSVVTYNVLSQMGARRLLRSTSGYVEPAILTIAGRREKLLREVLSYDADIMCLQEVDDYDDWWAAKLISNGYDSVYARRSGSSMDDGVVTAFRRDVFQLFCSKAVELNDLCATIGDPNLQARAKQGNVALLVCLQPWETSKLPSALCIANTQLVSGPTLESIRVLQAEYLCRQIAIFNANFHLPILLAGTFNALPSSDVYHVIHTGRRRPSPQAPITPERPILQEPTPTSITVTWSTPTNDVESAEAPILEYKVAVKNCASATIGFMHEIVVPAHVNEFTMTMLSSDVTYQFRVAARNAHGWSHFSQPSAPMATLVAAKLLGHRANSSVSRADSKGIGYDDDNDTQSKLYIVGDFPPQVKPYDPSFGSGRTPRFDNKELNLDVCPRGLTHDDLVSLGSAGAKRYRTLLSRADRDDQLVHGEQMESAYATYFEALCEPEVTFSSEHFQGTIDYIFYSTGQFAPFQLLEVPTADELAELGDDVRVPRFLRDVEWVKHKPGDWRDTLKTTQDEARYMDEWAAPELTNFVERPNSWLPNAVYPSDHLALACVFAIRKDNVAVEWN
uniref:Fibronectin type-III domain-containing protein n=1 Tax=Globisporangium ultimum (strain ATCC 200006 / CBS 805.95 / DAOM BR144) TaxID=431595 RepID=K3WS66_GLOUD